MRSALGQLYRQPRHSIEYWITETPSWDCLPASSVEILMMLSVATSYSKKKLQVISRLALNQSPLSTEADIKDSGRTLRKGVGSLGLRKRVLFMNHETA